MAFHRFKDMNLVEQVHIFHLSNIHTFEPNISLIKLFGLFSTMQNPDYRNLQREAVMLHMSTAALKFTLDFFPNWNLLPIGNLHK